MLSFKTDSGRFGILIILMFIAMLMVGYCTFFKPKGFDSESLDKIEALTKNLQSFTEQSTKLIQEVNENNQALSAYIRSRSDQRKDEYDQMMKEFLTDVNLGDLNFEIDPYPVRSNPVSTE